MFVAPPGTGKTNVAIAVALELGVTAIILTLTNTIGAQWAKRLKSFISGDPKVGLIQRDVCDYQGCDFVIISVKSLLRREYPPEALRCGLLIVDEAHHAAASGYFRAVGLIAHGYSLSLTATPRRCDGLGHIVEWLLGPRAFEFEAPKNAQVQVNLVTCAHPPASVVALLAKHSSVRTLPKVLLIRMISLLTQDQHRNSILLNILRRMWQAFPQRKGLLLSARVAHLETLYANLDPSMCAIITGEIHTEMTKKERANKRRLREEVKFEKFLTLSTYDMFAEAVDFDGDFIVLATPRARVEQSTGRILRGHNQNVRPIIFDLADIGCTVFEAWRKTRCNFYQRRGFEILSYDDSELLR